ncbi:MAG TPA: hypothetical protein PLA59_09030, partial [Myxococcota bacterium]|nr:hypothetical protein [Myxococcota bacterium]HPL25664.1 hypothetical protein [Myxococcota bacterium]HQE74117.1 hypothetical protein [Myxococcota bacterium]
VATGDFGPGRMPPDMFYNYNEEIKRQQEQTIRSHSILIGRICSRVRDKGGDRIRDRILASVIVLIPPVP